MEFSGRCTLQFSDNDAAFSTLPSRFSDGFIALSWIWEISLVGVGNLGLGIVFDCGAVPFSGV